MATTRFHRGATSLAAAMWLACGGTMSATAPSPPDAGGDAGPAPVPVGHRSAATTCATPRPPGQPLVPTPAGSPCSSDADCTRGQDGRCFAQLSPEGNVCSYDACTSDSDCGSGSVCACRDSANFGANTCFHGGCRIDADCGAEYCSPSLVQLDSSCINVPAGWVGYFCHTRQDACVNDSDCTQVGALCAFSADALRWQCYMPQCFLGGGGR